VCDIEEWEWQEWLDAPAEESVRKRASPPLAVTAVAGVVTDPIPG
jgi:hypothetical protein